MSKLKERDNEIKKLKKNIEHYEKAHAKLADEKLQWLEERAEHQELTANYIDIVIDLYDQLEQKKPDLTKEWYDLCVICGEEFKKNDVIQYFPVTDCMAHIDCMFLPKPEVTEEWIDKKTDELFHHTDELFKWEQLKDFIRSLVEEVVKK